jgi:hypothetical protein
MSHQWLAGTLRAGVDRCREDRVRAQKARKAPCRNDNDAEVSLWRSTFFSLPHG